MNANQKLAQHRLSVLELAQALGSVSEACKRKGMTRTMFYEYKKRFAEQGIEGLKDLPPIAKTHPFTTAPEVVERIKQLALEHPAWAGRPVPMQSLGSVTDGRRPACEQHHHSGDFEPQWTR